MEKELVELFEAAKKAADAAAIDGVSSTRPEVGRCVDALNQLTRFPVTYDMLISTQVGKRVRPLTKHSRNDIQIAASNLLDTWKKTVSEEAHKLQVLKKPIPSKPTAIKLRIKCNDPLREKIRENLVEALSKVTNEAGEEIIDEVNARDPIRVAVSVETVMFEKLAADKSKYRSIMFNLKDPKNPDLRRRVLLGEVKPERLVAMTTEEMASDERKRQNQQIQEHGLLKILVSAGEDATTDQFKCSKCGERKCKYYQMQTRSADEPMTTYVTCVVCNNHWKFC